jgi:hypothetical protein
MRRSTLVPSSFTGSTRAIVIAGAAVLVASGTAGAAWGMESRSAHVTPATVTSPVPTNSANPTATPGDSATPSATHSESASHSNTVTHAASAAPTVKQDDDTTGGETDAGESGVLPTAPDVTETNEGVGEAETTDGGAGSSVGREFPMTGGQHQGELQGLGTAGMMH